MIDLRRGYVARPSSLRREPFRAIGRYHGSRSVVVRGGTSGEQRREARLERLARERAGDPVDLVAVAQDDEQRDRSRVEAGAGSWSMLTLTTFT
jgi:hypothetical protein